MIIIDNKENTATYFKNVNEGEVFKVDGANSSYTYMRITSIVDNDDGTEYNATCLNDGDLMNFSNEDKVFTYPYSELIIKR
jgi:uncharacterized pyridoxamine 5'-phosphate oxidase family protein